MMFPVLASAFLVTVSGQDRDPTKVCLPDVLQFHVSSIAQNTTVMYAFNYLENVVAVKYINGHREIYNLTENTLFSVESTNSHLCYQLQFDKYQTYFYGYLLQCLPADAKLLSPADTHLGLSPESLDIEVWEVPVPLHGGVKIALTKSSPALPVFRQTNYVSDPDQNPVEIVVNSKTSIDDPAIFDHPDNCAYIIA